jgi:hypothetical protein
MGKKFTHLHIPTGEDIASYPEYDIDNNLRNASLLYVQYSITRVLPPLYGCLLRFLRQLSQPIVSFGFIFPHPLNPRYRTLPKPCSSTHHHKETRPALLNTSTVPFTQLSFFFFFSPYLRTSQLFYTSSFLDPISTHNACCRR